MSGLEVAVVNTRCANLASVVFACERLGSVPVVTADPATLRAAPRVILPGVGTAGAAMRELERLGLPEVLRGLSQPVLGICLGMQLLTEASQEVGSTEPLQQLDAAGNTAETVTGLGLMRGVVRPLAAGHLPLPHMGWNKLRVVRPTPLLAGLDGAYMYFVHSYAAPPSADTLAVSEYGEAFSAVLGKDNFYGVQFHPERSGAAGARLLRNFLALPSVGSSTDKATSQTATFETAKSGEKQ